MDYLFIELLTSSGLAVGWPEDGWASGLRLSTE